MVTLTVNILGLIVAMLALIMCIVTIVRDNNGDAGEAFAEVITIVFLTVIAYVFGCGLWSVL